MLRVLVGLAGAPVMAVRLYMGDQALLKMGLSETNGGMEHSDQTGIHMYRLG